MAEITKYLDQTGVGVLVDQIKAEDAKVLEAAKAHAEGLAPNYDAAGTAQSKMEELANGAVKTNTDAIAKLNGDAETEGSVDNKIALAKADLQGKIDVTQGEVDAVEEALAEEKARAEGAEAANATAAAEAKTAAEGAQATADAITEKVGDVPEGSTVMGIIANIQENAYDDTELRGLVDANADAIDQVEADLAAEVTRATGVEAGLRTDVDAIKNDYLKKADKDELAADIKENTDAIGVLNGTGEGSVAKQVADAVASIVDGAPEAYDTLKEISDWIAAHPESVTALNTAINENKAAIEALETLVGTLPEGEVDVVSYIQKLVLAEETRAKGVESGFETRIAAIEADLSADGETAKAIDSAQKAADTANAAAATAQAAADKAQGEVDAVEDTVATHGTDIEALKDKVATLEANGYDDTEVRGLITANAEAIDAVEGDLAEETARAQAAEEAAQNAANAAQTDVDNLEKLVGTLPTEGTTATTVVGYVDEQVAATDATVTAVDGRLTTAEGEIDAIQEKDETQDADIAALQSKVNSMVALTADEITAYFA